MARLQVLYLPARHTGTDEHEPRFGLVLDGLDTPLSDGEHADLDAFAVRIGAAGVYATGRTVNCDQGDVADADLEESTAHMLELVDGRINRAVRDALDVRRTSENAPKTTRVWSPPEKDPREGIPGWKPKEAADV